MGYEAVEVSARWQRAGAFAPEKVYWQEKVYPIESTGRSWEDPEGLHILCMIPGGRVIELVFKLNPAGWWMRAVSATGQAG